MPKVPLYLAVLPCMFLLSVHGAISHWNESDGGSFGETVNWSNGVPVEEDIARIHAAGTYTINLDQDRTVHSLSVETSSLANEVTLDLGGYTLIGSGDDVTAGSAGLFINGANSGDLRTVRLINGEYIAGLTRVGNGNQAQFIVSDGGVFRMQQTMQSRIGNAGNGTLRVEGTGLVEVDGGGALSFGEFSDSEGHMIVTGPQARFNVLHRDSTVAIGTGNIVARSTMVVTDGGRATLASMLRIAVGADSLGYLEVSEQGFLKVDRTLTVGGSGHAHALFESGAEVVATRLVVGAHGVLEVNNATVDFTRPSATPSTWEEGSTYRVHLYNPGDTPVWTDVLEINNTALDVRLGSEFVADLGEMYSLIDYTTSFSGMFTDGEGGVLAEGAQIVIGEYVFELSYGNRTDGIVGLELVAIPEPNMFAMGAVGLLFCVTWRRCLRR